MSGARLMLLYGIGVVGVAALAVLPGVLDRRRDRRLDSYIARRRAVLAQRYAPAR